MTDLHIFFILLCASYGFASVVINRLLRFAFYRVPVLPFGNYIFEKDYWKYNCFHMHREIKAEREAKLSAINAFFVGIV